jgi:hypothetical protein
MHSLGARMAVWTVEATKVGNAVRSPNMGSARVGKRS